MSKAMTEEEIRLYDATTIATFHDLSEIEYELKRRFRFSEHTGVPLYICDDETLELAIKIYNEPSVREEREAMWPSHRRN